MKYSIVVPVFNRPDEIDELLSSLATQSNHDFEVIVIEDGSTVSCESVCRKYESMLPLRYFMKSNSGPGQSRNYGVERAEGEYVLILDSDVVLPNDYLTNIEAELQQNSTEAFGGPDRAHDSFTNVQKAISYSMTSFFTTGGIRGGKKKLDKFYPRSFNMGVRRDIYLQLGGFSKMRFGEDIDFSIRLFKAGCKCRLFPEAWVWHKRRTDFRKFWRQVYNSGIARINLYKKYPESLKMVHLLPMVFTIGVALLVIVFILGILLSLFKPLDCSSSVGFTMSMLALFPFVLYALLIFFDASRLHHSIKIGFLSIIAAFIQLTGYGCGFIEAWWRRCVRGKDEFAAFEHNFYK